MKIARSWKEREKERETGRNQVPRYSISFDHPPFPASSCSNLRLTSATVNFGGNIGITDVTQPVWANRWNEKRSWNVDIARDPRYGCAPARGKRAAGSERMGEAKRRLETWRRHEEEISKRFRLIRFKPNSLVLLTVCLISGVWVAHTLYSHCIPWFHGLSFIERERERSMIFAPKSRDPSNFHKLSGHYRSLIIIIIIIVYNKFIISFSETFIICVFISYVCGYWLFFLFLRNYNF